MVGNYPPDVGFAWWLVENFWIHIAAIARDFGMKPLLAYPAPGPIPEAIRKAGIETVILPFPGATLADRRRSIEVVRTRDVRCIYYTDRPFRSAFHAILRAAGVRLILNHDHTPGDRPTVGGAKGWVKGVLNQKPLGGSDLQICVSPLIKERAELNVRIGAEKAVVVQNGIEPVECGQRTFYAHEEFGLPRSKRICVYLARAHPYKRVGFAIEVAKRISLETKNGDVVFIHCGDGPQLEELKERVRESGLEDFFLFTGRRSDVREILCSAEFALHPAAGEAFSLSILEYMSAGLAVLVPDIPTVCQAIRDGETGLIFPDQSVADAAGALRRLIKDPGLAKQLGERAAAEVRAGYTLEQMNQRFDEVIREALRPLAHAEG